MKRKELFKLLVLLNLIVVTGTQSIYAQARSNIKIEASQKVKETEITKKTETVALAERVEEGEASGTVEEAEGSEASEIVEETEESEASEVVEESEESEVSEAVEEVEESEASEAIEEAEGVEEAEVTEETEILEGIKTVNDTEEIALGEEVEADKMFEEAEGAAETKAIEKVETVKESKPIEAAKEIQAVKETETVRETEVIAENKPAQETESSQEVEPVNEDKENEKVKTKAPVHKPVEISVMQAMVSANQEAVKPQVVITGDFTNEQIEILILDKDGHEVGRHCERVNANGMTYDFAEIDEDGIYIMYIRRMTVDEQESISKYIFTINQKGTSFCYDMEMENERFAEAFSPRIKMGNVDAITILSCMLNGEEIPYLLENDEVVIAPEVLKGGKNQIALIVKDAAGNISEMKPWEFHIEKGAAAKIDNVVNSEVVRGNFWLRMLEKLLS